MSKSRSKKKPKKPARPKPLDENTSALALAEYFVLGKVDVGEIDAILEEPKHDCSPRDIAITFRISEVLGIDDQFVLAPRFEGALETLRLIRRLISEGGAA